MTTQTNEILINKQEILTLFIIAGHTNKKYIWHSIDKITYDVSEFGLTEWAIKHNKAPFHEIVSGDFSTYLMYACTKEEFDLIKNKRIA